MKVVIRFSSRLFLLGLLFLPPVAVYAQIACPLPADPSGNLLTNPGVEFCGINGAGDDAIPLGWEMDESIMQSAENGNETLAEGAFYSHRRYTLDGGNDIGRFWNMWFKPYVGTFTVIEGVAQEDNYAHLYQDVSATPGLLYTMKGHAGFEMLFPGGVDFLNWEAGDPGEPSTDPLSFSDGRASPTDFFFALEFLDAGGAVLPGSVEVELKANGQLNAPNTNNWVSNQNWQEHTLSAIAPPGTMEVRVRASMIDGVSNPDLSVPYSFNMSAFVDGFSLTASTPSFSPGDFDMDGDVDGQDFLIWQRNPVIGNLSDWENHFGSVGFLAASTAVPEPNSLLGLSLLAMLAWEKHGRWRCRS